MTYYIYLPIPALVYTIVNTFLTLDVAENIASMVISECLGRFIALTIFSIVNIVYFKKRKTLFTESGLTNKDSNDGQQLTLFDICEEQTQTVENDNANEIVNISTPVTEVEKKPIKEAKIKKILQIMWC